MKHLTKRLTAGLLIVVISLCLFACTGASYKDVSDDRWYVPFVEDATRFGIFEGDDGNFYPDKNINRAEIVTVLSNVVGVKTEDYRVKHTTFTDVKNSAWYAGAVKWAAENGVVNGKSTKKFAPTDAVTRAEMCTMLYRFAGKFGFALTAAKSTPFADRKKIPSWATDAVAACKNAGIVSGRPGNVFDPNGKTKRSESAKMLVVLVKNKVIPACGLQIHTIDVGQGDSIFIKFPNGNTMLIDAGLAQYGSTVVNYIKNLGYNKITTVIGTHPDADHIGGLAEVIKSFSVTGVYLPKAECTTKTYLDLLQTIKDNNLTVKTARAGVTVLNAAGCKAEIISPVKETYKEENAYSAVVKITYGTKVFLLMGDATTENEKEITASVKADWIKIAHHGSKTSSSQAFVDKVGAKYGLISVGEGNSYGLPKDEILSRWTAAGTKLYRTDENGTVRTYSNGKVLLNELTRIGDAAIATDAVPDSITPAKWVLNTNSKAIHRPSCRYVSQMAAWNKATSNKTVAQLTAEGYKCCSYCKPED